MIKRYKHSKIWLFMSYYNLHNLLKIESNVDGFPEIFKVDTLPKVDMLIKEGNFEVEKEKLKKLGLKFFGGDDSLYLEYPFYGRTIQRLWIKNMMHNPTEFYFSKFTGRFWGVDSIAQLVMEAKLLEQGCTFIHSGAITARNNAYLISAWSEMGKSSTVFGLAKSGYGVLGDDSVIMSEDGTVYSYPEKAGIYFHSKNVKNLNLSFNKKFLLGFKYVVSKLPPLHLYIDPNLRIDLSKILKVEKQGELKKCYFLELGEGEKKLSKKDAVNKMISTTVQALFGQFFTREVLYAYCYLNDVNPTFLEDGMKKILNKVLKDCRIIRSNDKTFYKYIMENVKL